MLRISSFKRTWKHLPNVNTSLVPLAVGGRRLIGKEVWYFVIEQPETHVNLVQRVPVSCLIQSLSRDLILNASTCRPYSASGRRPPVTWLWEQLLYVGLTQAQPLDRYKWSSILEKNYYIAQEDQQILFATISLIELFPR